MTPPSASLTNVVCSRWFFKTCHSSSYPSSDVHSIPWSVTKFKFDKHLCFIKWFIVGEVCHLWCACNGKWQFAAAIRSIFWNVRKKLKKICLLCIGWRKEITLWIGPNYLWIFPQAFEVISSVYCISPTPIHSGHISFKE